MANDLVRYREDTELMPEVQAASIRGAHKFAVMLLVVVIAFFAAFFTWASLAEMDEVTRGEGTVIPSRSNQIVQNLEGGIVAAIRIREGDVVRKGQVLLRIENIGAKAGFKENRKKYLTLIAMAARLQAEADSKPAIAFPAEVVKLAPEVVAAERALFQSRRRSHQSEIQVLRRQVDQRRQALAELGSSVRRLAAQYSSLMREVRLTRPLVQQGAVSQVELLRLERQADNTRGELETTRLAIPRANSAYRESLQKVKDKLLSRASESREALNKARGEARALREALAAGRDRVSRTEVRSPVRGTVKRILVATIGGVIKPGQDLVEIVPLDDTLLIEAKIRPSDVAFLRPGQQATVKITAYDFSIYGGLDARLVDISADTIKDEINRGQTFYRVRVRTNRNYLGKTNRRLPIIPGMVAQVEIMTGKKTVLDYLLKPILKARTQALRER